jgi:hypothetical protein
MRARCGGVVPRLFALGAVLAGGACAFLPDHDLGDTEQTLFIALASDFDGFEAWQGFEVESTVAAPAHGSEKRRVFINELPGEGAASFPVGTMIVKDGAGENGDEFHAMVKRADDFNTGGARGWEWFNLGVSDEQRAVIIWRGLAPPTGEGYGCAPGVECGPEADCNACHVGARGNDYVQSAPLSLR